MKSRKEALRTAKKLFSVSLANGQLDMPTVQKVVRTLAEKKPRGYMAVIDAYWRLVHLEVEKNRAVIESAVELDGATREKMVAELRRKYGSQIAPEFSINPALLGGMKIKVGSDVWDGSVKNRVERLAEKF